MLKVTCPQTIMYLFNKLFCSFRATPGPVLAMGRGVMAWMRSSRPSEKARASGQGRSHWSYLNINSSFLGDTVYLTEGGCLHWKERTISFIPAVSPDLSYIIPLNPDNFTISQLKKLKLTEIR